MLTWNDEGLITAQEPVTTVRIYNTNTGKMLYADVQVDAGRARVAGEQAIAGVPGTGAPITLDLRETVGARTNKLLPTGRVRDVVEVDGMGEVAFSLVDAAVTMAFVPASVFGLTGCESPRDLEQNQELLGRIDLVRGAIATMCGWASSPQTAHAESPYFPVLALVGPPGNWQEYGTGIPHKADECDFVARACSSNSVHKAYPVTGSIATCIAAALPGSVLYDLTRAQAHQKSIYRLGHPGGVMDVAITIERKDDSYQVQKAALVRTARRLMSGTVYAAYARIPWARDLSKERVVARSGIHNGDGGVQ